VITGTVFALTNLIMIVKIPSPALKAVSADIPQPDVSTLPIVTCGEGDGTMTLATITFTGTQISCETIWATIVYSLSGTQTDGTTLLIEVPVTLAAGNGWWWQVGGMLGYVLIAAIYLDGRKEIFAEELAYLEVTDDAVESEEESGVGAAVEKNADEEIANGDQHIEMAQ